MGPSTVNEHICPYCGYVYDAQAGDPSQDIAPGTHWDNVPEDWVCPDCGGDKAAFIRE